LSGLSLLAGTFFAITIALTTSTTRRRNLVFEAGPGDRKGDRPANVCPAAPGQPGKDVPVCGACGSCAG
jgi:hypothetical protein